MAWFILTSTRFDFDKFERDSRADRSPRHVVPDLAANLGATIHQPEPDGIRLIDRLGSLIYSQPQHWAQARKVLPLLRNGDGVFALGCDSGVPLALLAGLRRKKVTFGITFVDPGRARTRLVGRAVALLVKRLQVFVTTEHQAELAQASFGARAAGVEAVESQTDCDFFRPPETRPEHQPPLLVSCGVERRDYAVMTAGVDGMDIEGKVCFVSPNQNAKTQFTMPDPIPVNFDFRYFDFADLRDLYQEAEVVVVPLIENDVSAGLTALLEAMACAAPVVVTASPGMIQRLVDEQLVLGVPPDDPTAIREAVEKVLSNRSDSNAMAERARKAVVDRFSAARFVERIEASLRRLAD